MQEQRFLGEILLRRGAVAEDRLEALYAIQREKGIDLIDLLVNANVTDETTIAIALAAEAELPYVKDVDPDRISTALATRVPIAFAKSHKVLVVSEDDATVYVLVADPFDTVALDDVRVLFGKPVEASVESAIGSSTPSTASTSARPAAASSRTTKRASTSTRWRAATSSTPTTRRRSSAGSTRSSSRR